MFSDILLIISICLVSISIIGMITGKVAQTTICVFRDSVTRKNKAYRIKKKDIKDLSLDDNCMKLIIYYNSLSVADKLLLIDKLDIDYINRSKEQNQDLCSVE